MKIQYKASSAADGLEKFQNDSSYYQKDVDMDYLQEVLKIIKEDLRVFPKPQYMKVDLIEKTDEGINETCKKYYYKLSEKELGLFDNLEMIDHSDLHKTFIFSTNKFGIKDFENLVFVFFQIFGNDMLGSGKFNNEDKHQIESENFWFGRMWTDIEKFNCAVTLFFDSDGPKLELGIKW